ncbi:MAG: hypothetical protein NC122_09980 [Faecalibacterium sp.]|nr:hypothetical protein [Ruminococcus sp.]MCM1392988.1 hypothetical protein [Ruminococcus sp.]MCM1486518.1 hypothetical protein [Faecalibacterium sp.]
MLSVSENNGGIKGRFYDLTHPPEVTSEKISVQGAFPFYKITARIYRGIIPWNTVEAVSGKLKSRAILPFGVKADEKCGISAFAPKVLPKRVLFNSAVKTLEKMALDPTQIFVSVVDENAYLVDIIEKLVPIACRIQVITNCVSDYERLADRLLEEYGLSLIVSGRVDSRILASTVIISASATVVPLVYRGLLFTNERRKLMNATVLTGDNITLPGKFASVVPDDIDRLTFASALYELCSADELGSLHFENMLITK